MCMVEEDVKTMLNMSHGKPHSNLHSTRKNHPNHIQIWMGGAVFCGRPRMFNILYHIGAETQSISRNGHAESHTPKEGLVLDS